MDPKLRQKAAAEYLGIAVSTFRSYAIKPDYLPGRGKKPIPVWPVSRLEEFVRSHNDPKSRKAARRTA